MDEQKKIVMRTDEEENILLKMYFKMVGEGVVCELEVKSSFDAYLNKNPKELESLILQISEKLRSII